VNFGRVRWWLFVLLIVGLGAGLGMVLRLLRWLLMLLA
jgi:hypothetical protein